MHTGRFYYFFHLLHGTLQRKFAFAHGNGISISCFSLRCTVIFVRNDQKKGINENAFCFSMGKFVVEKIKHYFGLQWRYQLNMRHKKKRKCLNLPM